MGMARPMLAMVVLVVSGCAADAEPLGSSGQELKCVFMLWVL